MEASQEQLVSQVRRVMREQNCGPAEAMAQLTTQQSEAQILAQRLRAIQTAESDAGRFISLTEALAQVEREDRAQEK